MGFVTQEKDRRGDRCGSKVWRALLAKVCTLGPSAPALLIGLSGDSGGRGELGPFHLYRWPSSQAPLELAHLSHPCAWSCPLTSCPCLGQAVLSSVPARLGCPKAAMLLPFPPASCIHCTVFYSSLELDGEFLEHRRCDLVKISFLSCFYIQLSPTLDPQGAQESKGLSPSTSACPRPAPGRSPGPAPARRWRTYRV